MNDLKATLEQAGIDLRTLSMLRDVAVGDDEDRQDIPLTDIEQQYPIYMLKTASSDTLTQMAKLKTHLHGSGHTPVILGDLGCVERHWEGREEAEMPEAYLALARELNIRKWLNKQYQGVFADGEAFTEDEILGEWTQAQPLTTLDIVNITSAHGTKPDLYIGLFPTVHHWQAPAYLGFGCWNDCPCPEFHIAVHKHWHETHGAEIIAILDDRVVVQVRQPVTSKDAALALAKDQMAYCSDAVFQGYGKLRALASALLHSTYWSFWWD